MTEESKKLAVLRDQIDSVDKEIQKLINQRAACALEVAAVKQAASGGEEVQYYRPEREAQVLRAVMERNTGPMPNEEMAKLFREIMSCCLALEKPMKIAFLGPEGTYTHAAALKHFGHFVSVKPMAAIDEVFREVESGQANYGVVPVENSTEGMVNHTLDSFIHSPLNISGEVKLRIHHHLLSNEQIALSDVKRVYSHQQSLAQCRKWLDAYCPQIERVAVSSNSEAARLAKDDEGAVAIAGEMAAEFYGMHKLAENIEDQPDNTTRFLIIGTKDVPPSGKDKTSLLVSAKNKPGALYHVLEPFHRHGVSLTRLETRPSVSGTWAYVFFIDFEGHVDDDNIKGVIGEISPEAVEIKHLGSYSVGVL
ncbi:MAG: chorismate mutase/prephenate dehydratase [Oleiphilaceae bacterium]|jgi:chorismate mutase/prephenate dehydratase